MKNDKTKLIIWATVALIIGVIIGAFLIGPMTTTGNAKAAIKKLDTVDVYMDAVYVGPILKQSFDTETPTFGCPCGCPGFYFEPCDNPGGCLNCSCCKTLTPKK